MTYIISQGGFPHLSSNVYLNFDGCSQTSLALFLPPFYTSLPRSLPQAFCSSARREEWMVEGNVRHSVPVSEFLLRHGNAPTCLQTYSNTLCTWKHTNHTPTQSHTHTHTHKAHVDGNKHGKTWSCLIFLDYK